jgi:hypothetical protein
VLGHGSFIEPTIKFTIEIIFFNKIININYGRKGIMMNEILFLNEKWMMLDEINK